MSLDVLHNRMLILDAALRNKQRFEHCRIRFHQKFKETSDLIEHLVILGVGNLLLIIKAQIHNVIDVGDIHTTLVDIGLSFNEQTVGVRTADIMIDNLSADGTRNDVVFIVRLHDELVYGMRRE